MIIDNHRANSMASSSSINTALPESTTFTFGSWVCIANGLGDFDNHIVTPKKPEESTQTSSYDVNELADDIAGLQLSDLIRNYATHIRVNLCLRIGPDY